MHIYISNITEPTNFIFWGKKSVIKSKKSYETENILKNIKNKRFVARFVCIEIYVYIL